MITTVCDRECHHKPQGWWQWQKEKGHIGVVAMVKGERTHRGGGNGKRSKDTQK